MTAARTRATDALVRARVPHRLHPYESPERHGATRAERPDYGAEAAGALGVAPERLCKTLVAVVDGALVLAVVPVAAQLNLKALAAAVGGRRAELASAADAERATGYVIGGISPIGARRALPVVLDESTLGLPTVFVSAGRRGLQVELAPGDLAQVTGAVAAPIGSAATNRKSSP